MAAGQQVEVDIELDDAPRLAAVPADLADALAHDDAARSFFEGLPYTHQKEWPRWVPEAKKPTTRDERVNKTIASLRAGQRTR